MPRIIPEERYFSMPSIDVGADVRRNRALNCWPWVRSLTHSPVAVIHSPADIVAEWPTTVTRSRCPRALVRRTQKPFSALWKVTRSTRPARASWVGDAVAAFMGDVRDARVPCVVTKACGVPRAEAGRDASIASRALSPKAGLAGSICWFDLASLLGLSVTAIGSLS